MRRLRQFRLKQFLTQQALADRAGVALFTLQRWERSEAFPRPAQMGNLCAALGLTVDDLVEPDEWPQPQPRTPKAAAW